MSIEELIKENWKWLLGGLATVATGLFGWLRFRKKDKAETLAKISEAEMNLFKIKTLKDKYYEEREAKLVAKIDSLMERLSQSEVQISQFQKRLEADKVLIQELKSELTMYKTIKSTENK